MSRTRQVSAVDVHDRENAYNQPHSSNPPMKYRPNPYHNPMQPKRHSGPGGMLQRLRSSNTQALLTGGCSSMRDLCNSVQSITTDISNLLGSIESILPIIGTYLTVTQAKETIPIPTSAPANYEPMQQPYVPPKQTINPTSTPAAAPTNNLKQPKADDIQQFLENPLVKNILNNFMQNMSNNTQK